MDFTNKNGFNEIRIINTISKFVEIIGIINAMADEENYRYDKTFIQETKKYISKESAEFIFEVSKLRLKGIEMIEFLVVLEEFNDIQQILSIINTMDQVEYIYRFFGEEIDREEIQDILNNKMELVEILNNISHLKENNLEILECIFFQTHRFMFNIGRLIKEIDNNVLNEKFESHNQEYLIAIDRIKQQLKEMTPLDVSQDIMGKKFKRVYDFSRYIFIPSYYFNHRHIRFFNKTTQIQIYNISQESADNLDEVVKLLKIISDSTRLEILRILSNESDYGKEIADKMNLSPATISHHLDQLRGIGVLNEERIKNIKYYSTNPKEVKRLLDKIHRHILG